MEFVQLQKHDGIATLTLARGKVNAINGPVVDQMTERLKSLEHDPEANSIVLTGAGKFFSFGFDVPEFLSFEKPQFDRFLTAFTDLHTYLFLYPKPVVAALNGHAVAGGCMLALACDYRVMVMGKGKISLNELTFGASVFAGITEMLRFAVGSANAAKVLYSGSMYSAEEAKTIGLIDEAATEQDLMDAASKMASSLGSKYPPAFTGVKSLLRKTIAEDIMRRQADSIWEFVDIWYSEHTWANLKNIKIA
ncbi:MAG: enoyl-CoA hydratase/isomerase family protein [Dehalococcoidia bacterium]|nr:enoyl-CoA hydratase/isomerase family protein [Dehalococcoidia bacterium]